jgi:hypothetical protein
MSDAYFGHHDGDREATLAAMDNFTRELVGKSANVYSY